MIFGAWDYFGAVPLSSISASPRNLWLEFSEYVDIPVLVLGRACSWRSFSDCSKHDARRTSDGCVPIGKRQLAAFPIDVVRAQAVALLIAHVEELTRGIEVEVARMIAMRRFFPHQSRPPIFAD